jgi:putative transposase
VSHPGKGAAPRRLAHAAVVVWRLGCGFPHPPAGVSGPSRPGLPQPLDGRASHEPPRHTPAGRTDITYVRTAEHWLYLCVVLDLYSGLVVGWSMSPRQDRQLVVQAVLMAGWQRPGRTPVILHSDRGCQFTSEEYQRFLAAHQITCSMSTVGNCADNAAAESFFGVLKRERVDRRQYRTRAEARVDIFDYIERWHNPRQRRRLAFPQERDKLLTQPSVEMG